MDLFDLDLIQRFFAPAYLDNPIISTGRSRLLLGFASAYRFRAREQKTMFEITLPHREQVFIRAVMAKQLATKTVYPLDPEEYRTFLISLPNIREVDDQEERDFVAQTMKQVLASLKDHVPGVEGLSAMYAQPLSSDARTWYRLWMAFDKITQQALALWAQGRRIVEILDDTFGYIMLSSNYVAILYSSSRRADLILTYEQWMMLKDMCYSRYQVFCARLWLYPSCNHYDALLAFQMEWQLRCLDRYGNEGYDIAKNTEAVTKAYLSHVSDPIFGKTGPYPRMLDKVREKERKLGNTTPLIDIYARTLEQTEDVQLITELFGIQKMCGHPLIDPRRGGLSAAEEARIPDKTTYADAQRVRNNFCRIYLEAYVTKHGAWPPLTFSGATTTLKRLSDMQYRNLRPNSYPLTDWNTCKFKKHQEFDYHPNFLDLMDDKSISYYRSEKHTTWDTDCHPRSHKRLLREMISRETISAREIVELVMKRKVPLDWYIVSLYPKEREFKLAARMFSMLVFEIRLYFALTEANLAEGIFPYLPQQTMTKDKISILRTFGDITRPLTTGARLRYYLEIDLSRWNLRWRSLTVHMVGDAIDDIFGLRGVFTFVHEFFAECVILVRTPDIRPPGVEQMSPPETDTLWYNHHGGFEGITQKLWSACTYSMVDLGLQQFPLSYVLVGQGDNQIVAITLARDFSVSEAEQCQKSKDEVMAVLEAECAKTNQEMKPEECLESGTVLTYSKDVYVRGVDYHTSLKAHSRLFPNASSDFPSIMTEVGAIFSTALAGAERTRFPMSSYALALLHASGYLSRCFRGEGIYGRYLREQLLHRSSTRSFLRYVLLLPSPLGGAPIPTFVEFLYKGGSDPLSSAVAGVTFLGRVAREGTMAYRMLREIQDGAFLNPEPSVEALIKDPYGIPIRKPATPIDRVARETLDALRPHVKNADIQEILSTSAEAYSEELLTQLSHLRPMNPLIAHDLYDCSVAGLITTMSSMFTATRSIQGFVREGGSPIVERLLSQEKAGWVYLYKRWSLLPRLPPDRTRSIYSVVTFLREGWKKAGVPVVIGVTTYHPLDFPAVWGKDALTTPGVSLLLLPEVSNPFFTRGHQDPYLGSKTREKRSEHGYKIIGKDTSSASFRKLQLIMSQIGTTPAVTRLIDNIGHSRSNTTLSSISHLLTQVIGGTVSHRYASKVGYLAAHLLGSFTFASNCVISSDNAGFLSGGYVDYPVMFQEFFLTLGAWIQLAHIANPASSRLVTIRIGDSPLDELPSVGFSLAQETPLHLFRLPLNKLAFINDLQITQNKSVFATAALDTSNLRGHFTRTQEFAREVCTGWFRAKLREHNTGRMIADSNPTVTNRLFASLDLAETAAVGIGRLIDASAIAIAEEAIYHTWRTANKRRVRWKIVAFLWKLSEACSLILCEHLGHPLLKNDYACRKYGLAVTPTYRGGAVSVKMRVGGLVCARARKLIARHDSFLYTQTVAIFASDNERSASEVLYRMLCLQLHRSWLANELSAQEGVFLMMQHVIPLGRSHEKEEVRVKEAQLLGYVIAEWAKATGKMTLCENMLAVARGDRLRAYPSAIEEVLRDMRNSRLWRLYRKDPPAQPHGNPEDFPQWTAVVFEMSPDYTTLTPHARELPPQSTPLAELLAHRVEMSRGRTWGLFSSAHYSFLPVIRFFDDREVLVVGSGHGAVARLALEMGARMVYGLDLSTTIPAFNHNFRWYKPPMVTLSERSDRYLQLVQSFIDTGDWYSPSVSTEVLATIHPGSTIVLDIQQDSVRPTATILKPLIDAKWQGTVIWRTSLTPDEMCAIYTDLRGGKAVMTVFCAFRSSHSSVATWVIVFSRLPSFLVTLDASQTSLTIPTSPSLPALSFMGGGYGALMGEATHHLILASDDPSADEALRRVADFYDHTRGTYDARPTFAGWTAILEACASTWWLTLSKENRLAVLIKWARRETVSVGLPTGTVTVKGSPRLVRHIIKVASRLL